MLKVLSVCTVNNTVTVEHNNEAFECESRLDVNYVHAGEWYEFTVDKSGKITSTVWELIQTPTTLSEDEQFLVHGRVKVAPPTPQELELIDSRPPPCKPLAYVGAELKWGNADVTVLATTCGRAWVSFDKAFRGSLDSIVNTSELKPRKSPAEIEHKRLVDEALDHVEDFDSAGLVGSAISELIKAGYRKVK